MKDETIQKMWKNTVAVNLSNTNKLLKNEIERPASWYYAQMIAKQKDDTNLYM